MHDAERVRLHQRLEDLRGDASDARRGERAARDLLLERAPSQQLEDDEREPLLGGAEIVDAHRVRVLEPLHERSLAREALEHAVREHGLGEDHLDRDLATERPLERAIHGAVPALADQLDELVAAGNDVPRRERWGSCSGPSSASLNRSRVRR